MVETHSANSTGHFQDLVEYLTHVAERQQSLLESLVPLTLTTGLDYDTA